MFVFSSKCLLRTSIQKMLLVFTVLLNVCVTSSIGQIRIAELSSSPFSLLLCQTVASRWHTMDHQAPKIRKP